MVTKKDILGVIETQALEGFKDKLKPEDLEHIKSLSENLAAKAERADYTLLSKIPADTICMDCKSRLNLNEAKNSGLCCDCRVSFFNPLDN